MRQFCHSRDKNVTNKGKKATNRIENLIKKLPKQAKKQVFISISAL